MASVNRVLWLSSEMITKCSNLWLEELQVVRPRQASVLACVVLVGTSEGTSESKSSSVNSLYVLQHRVILRDRF